MSIVKYTFEEWSSHNWRELNCFIAEQGLDQEPTFCRDDFEQERYEEYLRSLKHD